MVLAKCINLSTLIDRPGPCISRKKSITVGKPLFDLHGEGVIFRLQNIFDDIRADGEIVIRSPSPRIGFVRTSKALLGATECRLVEKPLYRQIFCPGSLI